jgi:hypothetical protein
MAGQLADNVVQAAVATRGVKFGQWVREHAEGGAGALHKFTKPRTQWKPDGSVSFSGVDPSVATLQSVVDNEAKKWETLWHTRKEASAPDFSRHIENEPPLGRLTPAQIREAAKHFKTATGVGGDHIHPRWFAHLCDAALMRISFLFFFAWKN